MLSSFLLSLIPSFLSFFLSCFTFPSKSVIASPLLKQVWSNWNFSTVHRWSRFLTDYFLPCDACNASWRGISCRKICPSVCLSVCHTRGLWQNQTVHCGYFDTIRKGSHSSFLTPTVVGRRRPRPSGICAQSDPPPSNNPDFDRFPLITFQP